MRKYQHPSLKYLRLETLPTPFCAGCGLGIIANCFLKAVEELGFNDLRSFVFCSGIGCAAWIPSPHFKADSIHVTHGRSIPVAVGVKLVRPELNVVVFGGDGDLAGIGLSHLLHAARRNIEITVIMSNNMVYGMTGGQAATTTPLGIKTNTTPYGNREYCFNLADLLNSAGASYVARWTTAHPIQLKNSIKKALKTNGFSFIEVISQCPTNFGRRIGKAKPAEMLNWFKENSVSVKKWREEGERETEKFVVGEFIERKKPGFTQMIHVKLGEAQRHE